MLTLDDDKDLNFDDQVVLCQCQGQAVNFARRSKSGAGNDEFSTAVRLTKVGRVVPPVVEQPPCQREAASFACGQETQCYLDPACGNAASDSLNGLGCNAFGVSQYCRFCGGSGAYSAIPCPSVDVNPIDSEQNTEFNIEQIPVDAVAMPFNASGASGDDSIVSWDFEIDDLRQKCPTNSEFWTDALNRRIVWNGLNSRVSVLGNTQHIVEFMDHEGTGFYLSETENICDSTTFKGMTDPNKNCIIPHRSTRGNWATIDGVREGRPDNGAVWVETYELPFGVEYGASTTTFKLQTDLTKSCDAADTSHIPFHKNLFPTFRLSTTLDSSKFTSYKETFEVENFPYFGPVGDPKHSLAFLFFLSTSSRISFSGGGGAHNPFVEGPSFSVPDDVDCNAVPRPAECPFLLLDEEVELTWDLSLNGIGGPLIAPDEPSSGASSTAMERIPIRASVPEGKWNPGVRFERECTVPCPTNSTATLSTALAKGLLYCNPDQKCGARYVYYSFHPRGAYKLVWDPTNLGKAKTLPRVAGGSALSRPEVLVPLIIGIIVVVALLGVGVKCWIKMKKGRGPGASTKYPASKAKGEAGNHETHEPV